MSKSKSSGKISTHCTTAKGGARKVLPPDPESLIGYANLLKLRSRAESTQKDYLRYVRRIAARHGGDPAGLEEAQVREHLLHLKVEHKYSSSSMRTAVAALSGYYNLHLGRAWKLFDLVSSPSDKKLRQVLTREEVARLFSVIHTPRFLTVFRFIYSCGLRIGEAVQLEVGDLRIEGRVRIRLAKGNKDRDVPLAPVMLQELREFWKTHRHPRFIFPGVGRGWRDGASSLSTLATAKEPMGVGSIQTCMRLAVAAARLPKGTVVHTLRHSYATHMLDEGINIRLISAYLGHSSLETTMIYLHHTTVNEASARAAIARLLPPRLPYVAPSQP
jgi:integrase/recombinase XerD